jgi:hypothetical protein
MLAVGVVAATRIGKVFSGFGGLNWMNLFSPAFKSSLAPIQQRFQVI